MVQKALFRPFVLFAHEPILQLFGAYMALVYGLLYRTSSPHPFTHQSINPSRLCSLPHHHPGHLRGHLQRERWDRRAQLHRLGARAHWGVPAQRALHRLRLQVPLREEWRRRQARIQAP